MIPGTSRSGATILGAVLLGCSRGIAAEFSFFLAVPVMFGASLLKLIKNENRVLSGDGFGADRRHDRRVHRFRVCDPLFNGVYPQARLQGVRRVSDRLGNFGIRLLFLHEVRVQ